MFSKILKIATLLGAAGLGTVALPGDAHAVNTNIHGVAFQPYGSNSTSNLTYTTQGVKTASASVQSVIAAVPRDGTFAATQDFIVDGANTAPFATNFVIYAYNYNGVLQSSVAFGSPTGGTYDITKTLTTVTIWSYVAVLANLPPSGTGSVYGVTAIQ